MRRGLTYFLIIGLILIGIFAASVALRIEPKAYNFVTRSAVDSATFKQYQQSNKQPEPTHEPIRWSEITAAIVALTVAWSGIGFVKFKREIYGRFTSIDEMLLAVADQKNRDNIDARLVKIEQDAAAFVDDEKIKALIEGIGSRTRLFVRDVMQIDFTPENLEKANMKMNARTQDSRNQIKDLMFGAELEKKINEIRCAVLGQLKTDLGRLVQDRIHNSKYERFGEIICRFQRTYMKEVIKLHHEYKPEQ